MPWGVSKKRKEASPPPGGKTLAFAPISKDKRFSPKLFLGKKILPI
jgi:hypothetical protein